MTTETTMTCDTCHQPIDPEGPRYYATYTLIENGGMIATVQRDYHENHVPANHPKPEKPPA